MNKERKTCLRCGNIYTQCWRAPEYEGYCRKCVYYLSNIKLRNKNIMKGMCSRCGKRRPSYVKCPHCKRVAVRFRKCKTCLEDK